jgi:hypothetical protein
LYGYVGNKAKAENPRAFIANIFYTMALALLFEDAN